MVELLNFTSFGVVEKWCKLWEGVNCNKQTNSVALVRKQTIPTERPPLVGEVGSGFGLENLNQ
jgi:hypothetical protein